MERLEKKEKKKETALIMGGMGDSKLSNPKWERAFEAKGWKVVNVTPEKEDIRGERTFEDRVAAITEYVKDHPAEKVILVGQSSGGLAVLKAAEELGENVEQVISVSPAMPKDINPMSAPLLSVMWKYAGKMWRRQEIITEEEDYKYVISPGIEAETLNELTKKRAPISGTEASQLGGPPFGERPDIDFSKISANVFLLTGKEDRWVNPKAHLKLATKLAENLEEGKFMWLRIPQVGHMPSNAKDGEDDKDAMRTVGRVLDRIENPKEASMARLTAVLLGSKRKK